MPEPETRELHVADFGPLAHMLSESIRGDVIPAQDMPQPYRDLLAHDQDMTSTLEAFANQSLTLRVLSKQIESGQLWRRVLLEGTNDGRVLEFGAIRIELHALPDAARRDAIQCIKPLGSILHTYSVPFVSSPSAYLCVQYGPSLPQALYAAHNHAGGNRPALYGRRNTLSSPQGQAIADIIEVLPVL